MEENTQVSVNGAVNLPQSSQMNFLKRVAGMFFWPGKAMDNLAERPRIAFPFIFLPIVQLVAMLAMIPMYKEFVRNNTQELLTQKNLEITTEQLNTSVNLAMITGPAAGAIGVVITWVLGALILWGIIKIFKGQGSFKQVLSITGYAGVITILSTVVHVIKTNITGVYDILSYTSMAVLMPKMDGNFIYGMAKFLDVFSIWQYVVIAIGVAAVSKMPKKKAYLIVAAIFVIQLLYAGITEFRMAGLM
ncbi:Yip1 family protein [Clostridium sp. BNL1100]|uniref:Yip1 family protein n=1 Tax=Clostridium sp. BNL1100 TaxID=755731 RepID=UPI00024A7A4F|nr:Yip1 family protein [Clostridium sp. BNL1100]AEY65697.1 Yip1 domain protein [Clostridium sp. BNL1100]